MYRYHTHTIVLFFLFISNLMQCQIVSDNVFCYILTEKNKIGKNSISIKLLVYNGENDSIVVPDFNKNIYHKSAIDFRKTNERKFYWSLLTLSNSEPDNMVTVSIFAPKVKTPKNQSGEMNIRLVIPPKSVFVSDVFLLYSPFVAYPRGYYKLCIFDRSTDKCIADSIIEI